MQFVRRHRHSNAQMCVCVCVCVCVTHFILKASCQAVPDSNGYLKVFA